ncbi:MAG: hypothetical protein ACLGHP_09720 [Vicinamibacteria bacterium]
MCRSRVIIADVRDHPRQIYTSVRKPGRLRGLIVTKAPALHVAGLFILVLGVIAVVIVSLA